jgi:hypothetical protein
MLTFNDNEIYNKIHAPYLNVRQKASLPDGTVFTVRTTVMEPIQNLVWTDVRLLIMQRV